MQWVLLSEERVQSSLKSLSNVVARAIGNLVSVFLMEKGKLSMYEAVSTLMEDVASGKLR